LLLGGDPRFCHAPSAADVPRRIGDALSPRESSVTRNVGFVPEEDLPCRFSGNIPGATMVVFDQLRRSGWISID
jgi:hypothetical protein